MEKNLTSGSVLKTVICFSLPYLLSYFLQTLYGMADLFIIGQFGGVNDTTAVSVGSQVMHMLTVMIVGLAMGATVLIGRAIGASDRKLAARGIGNTISMFAVLSIVMTGFLLFAIKGIISLLSVPEEAINGTSAYLMICFAGIPFITAYNVISSIFRGMGDSKSPMYFVAVACVINIVLDYILMGIFSLGPSGAALGTTLSQMCSVLIALTMIIRKRMFPGFSLRDLRPHKPTMVSIMQVGFPVAIQDGFIQVSFLIITILANQRGLNDAAAVGIVEKLIGIFFLVPSSFLSTVSALSAQNLGAGKPDRARQTLRYAICITFSFGLFMSIVMQFAAGAAVSLFTNEAEVIRLGAQYMKSYIFDCMIAGIHFCCSGYFCALGLSGLSFLHNFVSIVVARIPLAWLACRYFPKNLYPMGFAAPIGSLVSVVICLIALQWIKKHPEKQPCFVHEDATTK